MYHSKSCNCELCRDLREDNTDDNNLKDTGVLLFIGKKVIYHLYFWAVS